MNDRELYYFIAKVLDLGYDKALPPLQHEGLPSGLSVESSGPGEKQWTQISPLPVKSSRLPEGGGTNFWN